MEYLSGEWLVESWYMKEHRYKWYLCAANCQENDEFTVVSFMMISYEWNVQVSFACWKYSWHCRGWEGSRRLYHVSFFVFSFKAEDTTIWEDISESKPLGLDPIVSVFVQNMSGFLDLGLSQPPLNKFFVGGCGAKRVVALSLHKELRLRQPALSKTMSIVVY